MRKLLIAAILLSLTRIGIAQGYNIGIRAGLNQSKFLGPTEPRAEESYGLNGGFHFGLNFQWNFNDFIGVRSEVLYTQIGSSYDFYSPQGYYIFNLATDSRFLLQDTSSISLNHSHAYIQLPQTIHITVTEKLELFAGGYIGFLINPVATGTRTFGGEGFTQEHSFEQGLDYDYFDDDAGSFNFLSRPILIRVIGQDVDLPGVVGAYYLQNSKRSNKYYSLDFGLRAGASYYLNRGLYLMLGAEYGMKDITRNSADISNREINNNSTFIYNNDRDRNFNVSISLGFRF